MYNSTVEPQLGMYAAFIRKNGAAPVKNAVAELYDRLCARDADGAERLVLEAQRMPLEGETSIID